MRNSRLILNLSLVLLLSSVVTFSQSKEAKRKVARGSYLELINTQGTNKIILDSGKAVYLFRGKQKSNKPLLEKAVIRKISSTQLSVIFHDRPDEIVTLSYLASTEFGVLNYLEVSTPGSVAEGIFLNTLLITGIVVVALVAVLETISGRNPYLGSAGRLPFHNFRRKITLDANSVWMLHFVDP